LYRLFCTGGINPSDPWNPLDNRDNGAMVFCRDKIGQYGILGHQFNKRFESFPPCCSQSLLQADFKLWFLKITTKKSGKQENLSLFRSKHFVEQGKRG
jgi:hypothetical protein